LTRFGGDNWWQRWRRGRGQPWREGMTRWVFQARGIRGVLVKERANTIVAESELIEGNGREIIKKCQYFLFSLLDNSQESPHGLIFYKKKMPNHIKFLIKKATSFFGLNFWPEALK